MVNPGAEKHIAVKNNIIKAVACDITSCHKPKCLFVAIESNFI